MIKVSNEAIKYDSDEGPVRACIIVWEEIINSDDPERTANALQNMNKQQFYDYLSMDALIDSGRWEQEELDNIYMSFDSIEDAIAYAKNVAMNHCDPIKVEHNKYLGFDYGSVIFNLVDVRIYDEEYDEYFLLSDYDSSYGALDFSFSNVYKK